MFEAESDMPHDVNATNGDTATFTCNAKGKPEADVQWFQNGVPIDCRFAYERKMVYTHSSIYLFYNVFDTVQVIYHDR